jgi:hypothetical protein
VKSDGNYVSRYDYAYDNTINKTRVIEANGDRVTWSYDNAYQLTRERRSGANAYDTTYSYDASQNRRVMIDSNARTTYTRDVANQLNWVQDATGRTTFAYDSNGNQTVQIVPALTRTTNVWDGENRLIKIQRSTDRSTYTYKADGDLRVVVEEVSETNRIIWDNRTYLRTMDASNTTQTDYTQTPTKPFSPIAQRQTHSKWYHYNDHIYGSTSQVTDQSSTVTDSYTYRRYGSMVSESGVSLIPYLFIGASGTVKLSNIHATIYLDDNSMAYSPLLGFALNRMRISSVSGFTRTVTGFAAGAIPPATCRWGVHCWKTVGGGFGTHCSIFVGDGNKCISIDGNPSTGRCGVVFCNAGCTRFNYTDCGDIVASKPEYQIVSGPWTAPASLCACFLQYAKDFTIACPAQYGLTNCNSNWALGCALDNCGVKVIGIENHASYYGKCRECIKYEIVNHPGCDFWTWECTQFKYTPCTPLSRTIPPFKPIFNDALDEITKIK